MNALRSKVKLFFLQGTFLALALNLPMMADEPRYKNPIKTAEASHLKFEMYRREIAGMSDSDPKKSEILFEMACLCGQLDDSSPEKAHVLAFYERAAALAEKCKLPIAGTYFNLLAQVEVTSRPDQAITHCQHAIELYDGRYTGGLTSLPGTRGVTSILAGQGRSVDSYKLLREAADRMKSVYGNASPEAAGQLCSLVLFHVDQKNDVGALPILDELLRCDVSRFYANLPFGHNWNPVDLWDIYRWGRDAANRNQTGLGLDILNRILAAQKRSLASHDIHIATTLLWIGDVYRISGNEKDAEENYQQAFDILRPLFGMSDSELHRKIQGGNFR